jgi:urea transport system substrate-binding protein
VGPGGREGQVSTDTDKVIAAMGGQTFKAPSGFTLTMDATNHHLHKPVLIGEVQAPTASSTWCGRPSSPVRAQPWSPFIEGNEGKQKL